MASSGITTDRPERNRWPDLADVPRAPLRAAVAAQLVKFVLARVDGPALRVNRPGDFHRRLGARGMIGLGEAYQAGDWDSNDLAGLLTAAATEMLSGRLAGVRRLARLRHLPGLRPLLGGRMPAADENTVDGARRNIGRHYDLSNQLFALFLDETMAYSSALFSDDGDGDADADLAAAQRRKIDRLLDHSGVGAGTRLLEIGTGWGELAIRAARRGAEVHTITISEQQYALATQRVAEAGLADRVTIELRDYRDLTAEHGYDAIVSVEMIEAVGERYWPAYFATLDRMLAPSGRVGLQAIVVSDDRLRAARSTYTWLQKYIFPGGVMLSVSEVERQLSRTGLRLVERHAFGRHYARTLRLWRERFLAAQAAVAGLGFDETFRRTWEYYLAYCEAGFVAGELDVEQLILSPRPA